MINLHFTEYAVYLSQSMFWTQNSSEKACLIIQSSVQHYVKLKVEGLLIANIYNWSRNCDN